jgi:hypothetical protein
MGIGPLPWMMNGELFPEECKATSSSIATAINWLTAFLVTKFTVNLQGRDSPIFKNYS